tara:strand:+ start:494 stop:643 length:150 start_codon:yes stop_codon:yes gene_type:complete
VKHGKGLYTWRNGKQYDGNWENGKQHGEGLFTTSTGQIRKGIWVDGVRT